MADYPSMPGPDELERFRLSRRALLQRALALGLSAPAIGALLAACGGDDDDDDDEAEPTAAGGGSPTAGAGAGSPTAAGGAATTGGAGQPAGQLIIGANLDSLLTFDPGAAYEFPSFPPFWAIYQCMLLNDPNDLTVFQPILCEEVPTVENGGISADGLTYTFKLKPGLKFSTGGELQAKDFVFAANRLAYLKGNPSFLTDPFVTRDADGNPTAVNVAAVDDYTVAYTLAEPNAAFLAYMASIPGIPYDSEFVKTQGALDTAEAETNDTAKEWFDQNSAGVGPYQLTAWRQLEEVVLEPFADSYAAPANYEQIVFRHIADSATQLQQLQGDAIDFAWNLDPDAINELQGEEGFQILEQPGLVIDYFALHNSEEVGVILSDVRVRQAVAYSIDYDGIVNELRSGAAVRPASMIPIGFLGADKLQEFAYAEDLEKAQALLEEAGAADGEFTITFRANPDTEIIVSKLQADIQRSGLTVNVSPGDPAIVLEDFRASKLQSVVIQWGPDYLDVHTNAYPFGGVEDVSPSFRAGYINEENTELLAEAIQEQDKVKREELYVEIGQNMIEDAAFIPLFQGVTQYAANTSVSNIEIHQFWFYLVDRFTPAS
jgi:peptide/nickel transport system substrate-binding protein